MPALGLAGIAEQLGAGTAGQPVDADLQGADNGARLRLLGHADRAAPPRQRTLRDALAWSHALPAPAEQRVLRRIAVFRAGFTRRQARLVAGDETLDDWAVLDALQALVVLANACTGANACSPPPHRSRPTRPPPAPRSRSRTSPASR